MTHAVAQQVRQHLVESNRVYHAARQIRGDLGHNRYLSCPPGDGGRRLHRRAHQRTHIRGDTGEAELAHLGARKGE